MNNHILKRDFHKLDVYRFDVDHLVDDLYEVSISNSISWDIITLKVTKKELFGLADFINTMIKDNT